MLHHFQRQTLEELPPVKVLHVECQSCGYKSRLYGYAINSAYLDVFIDFVGLYNPVRSNPLIKTTTPILVVNKVPVDFFSLGVFGHINNDSIP